MTLEYWHELARQTLLIASLLFVFSMTVVANLLVSNENVLLARIYDGTT